ncbi:MAG: pyridine nucleotide-disulfide oxidoreductase [Methylobacter sp.]|nr:MAG: pyridine nucleotide-disulfide oxidoreductase [Methylobacter sp.]
MSNQHYTLLIIGGGAAGISIANNMRRQNSTLQMALVEPSEKHYYQPGFTIVGGGAYTLAKTLKPEAGLIPAGVTWIKDYADSFQPENNTVTLRNGDVIGYDYLVVCPGLQLDWHKVSGLQETLGKNNVCSNYSADSVEYTWECIQNISSGNALFTQPPMPIKCAGAPQKIMYLAADRFRKKGILDKFSIEFYNAGPAMFGVPFFAKALVKVAESYGAKINYSHNLIAIDGANKTATFEVTGSDGSKEQVTKAFDMIHVTPPQSAPDFIKQSPLANAAGWVEVNEKSLQHPKYGNIFALGDVAATTNAKTAAAVRKQVPVVVDNILALMQNQAVKEGYDGYGSCPLTTSIGKVMLAEFSYGGKVTPSFPWLDPRVERSLWWWGKTTGFPWLYWHIMLKGLRIDIPHLECYAKRFMKD